MEAIWKQTALPEFPRLEEDLSADVLVIGGRGTPHRKARSWLGTAGTGGKGFLSSGKK